MSIALLGLVLATGPGASVEWGAPPGCPSEAQVLAQARTLLGGAVLEQAVAIRGAIEPAPTGFVLEIEIRTPSGATRKTAHADDCAVLASVAALMVAVAVDPVQATHALGIETTGTATTVGVPEPQPAPAPAPAPAPGLVALGEVEPQTQDPPLSPAPRAADARAPEPRPRALRGLVRASGSIGRGLVPNLDGTLALGLGLLARRLRAELVAFHVLAQEARYPAPSTAGVTVAAWGGSVRVGPRFEVGPLELHALGGIAVSALTAAGFGVRRTRTDADAHVALSLIPGVRWSPSPRVAIGADLEAEAAVRRPAFTIGTRSAVYRAASLGVRGSVVIELRWGPPSG